MDNKNYVLGNMRYIINFLILSNIVMLVFYSILRNPLEYSMSMIGNRFEIINLYYFVFWSVFFAGSTYYILTSLYNLIHFDNHLSLLTIRLASIILIVTTLIPAKVEMPLIRGIHIGFSVIHVILFAISFHPFITSIVRGKKKLNTIIIIWMTLTWPGSIILLIVVGWNAIYQLSYFINVLLLLMYFTNYILNDNIQKLEKLSDTKNLLRFKNEMKGE